MPSGGCQDRPITTRDNACPRCPRAPADGACWMRWAVAPTMIREVRGRRSVGHAAPQRVNSGRYGAGDPCHHPSAEALPSAAGPPVALFGTRVEQFRTRMALNGPHQRRMPADGRRGASAAAHRTRASNCPNRTRTTLDPRSLERRFVHVPRGTWPSHRAIGVDGNQIAWWDGWCSFRLRLLRRPRCAGRRSSPWPPRSPATRRRGRRGPG